jgi:putative spermidine/putrescine transport system permease protein
MIPSRYPISWRILDGIETAVEHLWPRSLQRFTPWLMLLPALVLIGLLVFGLVRIADQSLRTLDVDTFTLSAEWSLTNYRRAFADPVFLILAWRSVLGAAIVTLVTLIFAFPYAYLMVRTPSGALRKFLLIALFLPFFIGQVVRAYGWLIILGNQGIVNDALGLVGIEPMRLLFNYPAVLFGLVQYMLPFAVLMLAPALTAIPEEIEAAAGSLGANWVKTFTHVLLPLARPGLVGAGLVVMTLTLTDFAVPVILGGGSQDFIANAVYDQFFRTADSGLGSAITVLLVALGSMIVALVFALFGAGTLAIEANRK